MPAGRSGSAPAHRGRGRRCRAAAVRMDRHAAQAGRRSSGRGRRCVLVRPDDEAVSRKRYESAAAKWRAADAEANDERAVRYEMTGQPNLAQQQRQAARQARTTARLCLLQAAVEEMPPGAARDAAQQLATPDWTGTVDELLATARAVVHG